MTSTWRLCLAAAVLAVVPFAAHRAPAATEGKDFLWIEAENTATANVEKTMAGSSHGEFLTNDRWMNIHFDADKLDAIPGDGMDFTYALNVPSAGKWELWDRIGFEFVRSDFEWRIDQGEWHQVPHTELTTDLMELDVWSEIAWLKLGTPELTAGQHTLEIKVPKTKDDKGKPQRILYATDALVLAQPGVFTPNSKYKPGETRNAPIDQEAQQKTFAVPAPKAGERGTVDLDGPWQIARADEDLPPKDVATPMEQPKAADGYIWTGISVPGDKNIERPDLLFAHRLWYRTKLDVPAADAGRSFFITFPQNNLNTTVYVNGQLCGFDKNPFAEFSIDITKAVKPGQTNEVWVGIRDAWYGYTNDPSDPMKLRRAFNYPVELFGRGFQQLAYPIWNHPQSGLLVTPTLTVAGPVQAADVFVRPSVSKHQLDADVTLRNTTDQAANGQIVLQALAEDGSVAHSFPAKDFSVDAGKTAVVTAGGAWADAKLWWPDSPTMYTLRTAIQVNGQTVDTAETPFGFREWSWAGHDFKLNGIVWHGWADCFTAQSPDAWLKFYKDKNETTMRFWGTSWHGLPPDQALSFFDKNGVVVRRSGILDGEAIGYMAIENDPDMKKLYDGSELKMDLLNNWKDQIVAQVKGERNHPSVQIWSIENEWLYINCINLYGGLMDQFEKVETEVSNAVMAADPTRPTMTDGGGACKDDSMPVHGNHYVAGNFTQWPALAYEDNPTGGGRGRWVWDEKRPRFIGEDLFISGNHPEFSTFGGEAAFTGKQGSLPAAGLLISMAEQGYRWANYGAWQYWMGQNDADGSQYKYMAPRVALIKEWDWTFGSGQNVKRTVAILNDTHYADPITFTWTLNIGGKKVAGNTKQYDVTPGERQTFDLDLAMPQVADRTEGTLDLALAVDGKTVWTDSKAISVLNTALSNKPAGIASLNDQTFAVYDPKESVSGFLKAHGIAFRSIGDLNNLPTDAHVLLIGRDALTRAEATSSALAAWAVPGRSLIVLEQTEPLRYQGLPCQMDSATNEGRVGFIEDNTHPVVAGLKDKDLFTWGDDQVLYHDAYDKPLRGAKSLIQCNNSLQNTGLVEVPTGKGVLLLSQLAIGEKINSEAAAQKLLENLLNYAATYKQVFRPTSVAVSGAPALEKAITAMGLEADQAGSPLQALGHAGGLAVINASPENLNALATHLSQVQKYIDGGGWIVFNGLTPEGLAAYDKLVGVDHIIRPFGSTKPTLTKDGPMAIERVLFSLPKNHLTAGLTSPDVALYSSKRIFPWTAGNYTLPDEFSYVVDIDDVAPFATSDFANFGNIVNGFSTADGWPLIINFPSNDGKPFDIDMTLPRAETLTEITYQQNLNYQPTPKFSLIFDGDRAHMQTFELAENGEPQTFAINPPVKATKVTLELPPLSPPQNNKANNYGIDNITLKAQRPAMFYKLVKPMLNIGAMVEYPRGNGGFVLCNVNYAAEDDVPANVVRKRNMLATILRNLDAPFAGGKTVIAGANLAYTPIDISAAANQFRDEKGWFGDKSHTFKDLPVGAQKLAGVNWDIYEFKTSPVPQAVMLGARGIPGNLPEEVKGIKVNQKADALFFLQAARVDQRRNRNEIRRNEYKELAKYVVHYADGQTAEIPVMADYNVANYLQQGEPQYIPGAQVAWTKPYADQKHIAVAYTQQWNNPRPGVEITSIDLDPGKDKAGVPALLALTAASAR